jgi:hypothetical protein
MSEEFPEMYERSEPVQGGQRVVVVDHAGSAQRPLHQWPIPDLDPASIEISDEESYALPYGSGVLLEGDHADAMRDFRRLLNMQQSPDHAGYVWYTADQQPPEYRVYPRDVIPWEDERGLIDFGFE